MDVVDRYLACLADPASGPDDLRALLHPEVRFTEHPNLIGPDGTEQGLDELLAGFDRGRRLLARQGFEVRDRIADGDLVILRGVWRGVVADGAPLPAGAEIRAHIAMFVTLRDGLVWRQENFDCYEPLPLPAAG